MIGYFLASLRKDLRRFRADPGAMLLWLGIPVVIGSLMHVATGGSDGPKPVAHLILVDEDESWLSELLSGAGGGEFLEIEEMERAEAEAAIGTGAGSAMLVLPEGFAHALLTGAPATLELVTNPAQRILPGILQEGLELFVEAAFYAQELLGEPLREITQGPADGSDFFPELDTARIAIDFQRRFQKMEDGLFPPKIELQVVSAEEAQREAQAAEEESADEESAEAAAPALTFSSVFFPGLVYMGLLFSCLGLSLDLWREREMGTLRRALATPNGALLFLAGKLAAGTLVLGAVCALGIALGIWAYGYPFGSYLGALAWATFSGAAFLAIFMALQGLSRSERGGNVMASLLIFPLIMLGGSFFPFEAMPGWMADVGRWTPNGLAVEELKQILFDSEPTGRRAIAVLVLGLSALFAWGVLARRVRRETEAGA